jgi:hypothetical protein
MKGLAIATNSTNSPPGGAGFLAENREDWGIGAECVGIADSRAVGIEEASVMSAAKWLNFLMYELGWLACVCGAAWGAGTPGAAVAFLLVLAHIALATARGPELRLVLIAAVVGCVVDGLCLQLDVLRFTDAGWLPGLPPFWMTVLWMQFATTLRFSLSWLRHHLLLAGFLGLAGAPAAFWGGARLGAVELLSPVLRGLLLLGFLWSLAMPLLVWLSSRDGGSEGCGNYRLRRRIDG